MTAQDSQDSEGGGRFATGAISRAALVVAAALIGLTTCIAQDKHEDKQADELVDTQADKQVRPVSDDARAILDRLLQISSDAVATRPVDAAEADRKEFVELLGGLGAQIGKQAASEIAGSRPRGIEQALMAMAADRVAHPERYQEILSEYVPRASQSSRDPVALRPKRLEPRHASEDYRLVWESLILEPPSAATILLQESPIVSEALARIRDERSIPVIVYALGSTSDGRAPESEQTRLRQIVLLQTLGRFATKPALDGIFEVLSRCEGTPGRTQKLGEHTVREWVFRLLTDQENFGNRPQWLDVLKRYPSADLSILDREMVEQVLTFRP